ncbi:MAG: ABC transporter ATP-binding protein, partial [Caldilineaceae bacterium]
IPFILAISVFFFRLVSRAYDDYQKQEAVLTTTLQENVTGVRVVKAFARQQYEEGKFEDANYGKYRKGKHLLLMHSLYWPISDVLCGIQMVVGFLIGAIMAMNGTITVGTYVAYSGMVILIIWPMRNLGRLVVDMSRGLVSFQRVASIINEVEEPIEEADSISSGALRGDIVFRNVGFAYQTVETASSPQIDQDGNGQYAPDEQALMAANYAENEPVEETEVSASETLAHANGAFSQNGRNALEDPGHKTVAALKDISFQVSRGQKVALLGGTGAGKTSLVNLLPRFYDYTSGSIQVDGVELRKYSRKYLRQNIGIVEQEPFLFSRTVRDNITYGVGRDVAQQEVEEAAKAAAIHDVIMEKLPDGYDTLVGERGTTLSGGQKQRIAIARTLLKDPRILILDDSTSSVDTETEAAIRQALERLMVDRTTFIIAHRIQSVMNADLILVLNRGMIVQAGTHEELLQEDGMYRRIYRAQTRIEDELQKELSRDSAPGI